MSLRAIIGGVILVFASHAVAGKDDRPYRAGFLKLAPDLDVVKPLAMADYAGWVISSDVMVGAVSDDWVVGISTIDHKILWWLPAPTPLTAPITAIGSWVLLGFRDGKLLKVETLTGKKVWETTLDAFLTRQVALGGTTLVAMTASQQVYGLDFQSGATAWLHDAGFPDGLTINAPSPPVVQGDRVYIGLASGEIEELALANGKPQWRQNPEFVEGRFHDYVGDMILRSGRLVFTRYDGLVAGVELGDSDKKPIWKETLPAITTSSFRNGRLYVGCINGDVYSYDATSGRRLWRHNTGESVTSITAGENIVYAAGSRGRITAVDQNDGTAVWNDDVQGTVAARPIVMGGVIYFETGLKNFYGYMLR